MLTANPTEATAMVKECLAVGLVPMLHSSPGMGKSDIVKAISIEKKLKLIDLRLSQCEPNDLLGYPRIEGNKSSYIPMDTFPIESDTVPTGYNGYLLFFDELTSASHLVQAASYKIILDRKVGQFDLHKDVYIVCAGNLATDKAIVTRMSTAMQSRLVHINIHIDEPKWQIWAANNNINPIIRAFISYRPDMLQKFDPNHNDNTFSCPRTWEFASKLCNRWGTITYDHLVLLAGTLSEGVAREFYAFTKIMSSLDHIDDMINNPNKLTIPKEPSTLYAIYGYLLQNASVNNIDRLIIYINRLPKEFQVLLIKGLYTQNPDFQTTKVIEEWVSDNANDIM